MKTKVTSAKGAQANHAIVLTGNGVSNQKNEEKPLFVLPIAPEEKAEKKVEEAAKVTEKTILKEEPQQEAAKVEIPVTKKHLSIDELNDKADRVYLLKGKYQEIREKRKQLEKFTISHDQSNAQLTLVDANGLTISTSNPTAIRKLLMDWMIDLVNHMLKTEDDIRKELEA